MTHVMGPEQQRGLEQQRREMVRAELDGEPTHRVVVELDARLVDPTWTEQDLRENLPDYLITIIDRAEQDQHSRFPDSIVYRITGADLTVWTKREDYLADIKGGLG